MSVEHTSRTGKRYWIWSTAVFVTGMVAMKPETRSILQMFGDD